MEGPQLPGRHVPGLLPCCCSVLCPFALSRSRVHLRMSRHKPNVCGGSLLVVQRKLRTHKWPVLFNCNGALSSVTLSSGERILGLVRKTHINGQTTPTLCWSTPLEPLGEQGSMQRRLVKSLQGLDDRQKQEKPNIPCHIHASPVLSIWHPLNTHLTPI